MAWRIKIDKDVQRSMKKLDSQIAKRIVAKLREISQLEDLVLVILVVGVDHRNEGRPLSLPIQYGR